jgi:hypothetical protein
MRPERSTKDGPWYWVNFDSNAYALTVGGSNALLVYQALCARQSKAGGKEVFFASASNLAATCGLGIRTVERYLPLLIKSGLIEFTSGRRAGKDGAHQSNLYRLPAPPSATRTEAPSVMMTDASATDSGFKGGQIEGSSRREEEHSAASAGPAGAGPHAAKATKANRPDDTKPRVERPWY